MRNYCFVTGCRTGYPSSRNENNCNGTRHPSLFYAPKDVTMLEKWRKAVPSKDKELTSNDKICELHFQEDCIERYFESKMPDGSSFQLERGRPLLKKGSVPSVFPDLPYLSIVANHRKVTRPRQTKVQIQSKKIKLSTTESGFNFNTLQAEINLVKKPDSYWMVGNASNFVICVTWNEDYSPRKRVVVDENLEVKVFINNRQVSVPDCELSETQDLSVILQKVHQLVPCSDIDVEINEDCHGYIKQPLGQQQVQKCKGCQILKRKTSETVSKKSRLIVKLPSSQRICARREANRLKQKISSGIGRL